jgi:hypothetical protein
MNRRAKANEITELREKALSRHLNGELVTEEDLKLFPCSEGAFRALLATIRAEEPTLTGCSKQGGLSKHKDVQLLCGGGNKGIELKVSDRKLTASDVEWQPWEGGVQFLQGQVISKELSGFLGPCGMPMVSAWFEKVKALMREHLPTFAVPTPEDYTKVCFREFSSFEKKFAAKKITSPAALLINELRTNETVRQKFQEAWLLFEGEWLESQRPDLDAFLMVLKETLKEKDYWVNINGGGAFFIEGFTILGLQYVGTAKKPKGGTCLRYKMKLQKKKCGDCMEVPFVLKFHWKNGGQGVQNINFLLVSDPFA